MHAVSFPAFPRGHPFFRRAVELFCPLERLNAKFLGGRLLPSSPEKGLKAGPYPFTGRAAILYHGIFWVAPFGDPSPMRSLSENEQFPPPLWLIAGLVPDKYFPILRSAPRCISPPTWEIVLLGVIPLLFFMRDFPV